jgi:hypothetical protein
VAFHSTGFVCWVRVSAPVLCVRLGTNHEKTPYILHAGRISNAIGIPLYVGRLLDAGMIRSRSESSIADPVTLTASAILVLFDGAVFATNMLAFTPEIVCVTAGTEWRVL